MAEHRTKWNAELACGHRMTHWSDSNPEGKRLPCHSCGRARAPHRARRSRRVVIESEEVPTR